MCGARVVTMIWDSISRKLQVNGYVSAASSSSAVDFYVKTTDDSEMSICVILKNIDFINVSADSVNESAKRLENKFLLSGYKDVHVMHIIFSDKNIDIGKLEESGYKFWLVDLKRLKLMVFENQPENYCGLKGIIEQELDDLLKEHQSNADTRENHLEHTPFITLGIVAINVVAFLLCEMFGSTEDAAFMERAGALSYTLIYEGGEFYRIITSMFLHFGFEHIVNNMFMLVVLGMQAEKWLGHLRFMLVYLASGVGASIASVIYHMAMQEDALCAGASGAIYGIFGTVIVMMVLNRKSGVDMRRILFVMVLLVFGSIQENIDFVAHIGGLITGMITTYGFTIGMINGVTSERR